MVLYSPFRGNEHVGRRLADESLQHEVFSQSFDVAYADIYVFVGCVKFERLAEIVLGKLRASDYL